MSNNNTKRKPNTVKPVASNHHKKAVDVRKANDLLPLMPHKDISLFDIPELTRRCIDKLKSCGIGMVRVHGLTVNDNRLQVTIHYFPALNKVCAEVGNSGRDNTGYYQQFRLFVCDGVEVVWTKTETHREVHYD
jgi:hypothetical protein